MTDTIALVEKACRERGLRLTRLRAEVLRLVAESARPAKAYDVLERIRESKAITAPPTVYRSLDFLLDNGFIHKLESINAFVACRAPQTIHTGTFLICDGCHAASEVMGAPVAHRLKDKARALGFLPHPRTKTLEVHGLCANCRVAAGSDSTKRRGPRKSTPSSPGNASLGTCRSRRPGTK